jgi:multidrug efflux pump subunit AcrA (membrane-fusion protein)
VKRNLIKYGILAILLLALAACNTAQATEAPTQSPVLSDFSTSVSATARVVPESEAALSVSAAGVVQSVPVAEGDTVQAGQLLVQIKGGEQAAAAITAAQLELANSQNHLNTLYENTELQAASALQQAEQAEDALEDLLNRELQEALALKAIADAQKLIDITERSVRYLQTTAGQDDIDIQKAQVALAEDALDKAIDDFEPWENKPENNLTRANLLARKAAAQQVYDDAVRRLNALEGTGDELDIAVAEADYATAQAQLLEAQRSWERIQDGPNAGDIAVLEAQIDTARRDFETYSLGPDPDDVAVAEARLANAEAQLSAAESVLDDLQLMAPFDGIVAQLNINADEWVVPGQPVIVLADLSRLQVETTDLGEIDVARIQIGDLVEITFDALPDLTLTGTVATIPPKASEGSAVNYSVIIELDEIPDELRWGMTAFVDIDTE